MIPKIIHQTWKTSNLDNNLKKWSNSWKLQNFEYKFYDDNNCLELVKNYYPQYLNLYLSVSTIEKADIFRYLVLHKYGGFYCDIDTECIGPIEELIGMSTFITGIEYYQPLQYLQWFIASSAGNNILIEMMSEIIKRQSFKCFLSKYMKIYWSTGPILFTDVLLKTKEDYKVLKKGELGCYDTKIRPKYLIHHFKGSWKY